MKKVFSELAAYAINEQFNAGLRIEVEMKENIDEECLIQAVQFIEKRCAYLKVSYVRHTDAIYIEENDLPFVVRKTACPIALNCSESNNHVLAFSWYGNIIYVNFFHASFDGAGLMRLTKNLLYQYCAVKYGTPLPEEGIWHMDDVIRPEENCDPYLEISKDISMLGETQILTPKPETKHFDFWEDGHMKKDGNIRFKIVMDQKDLMQYCSSYDGSPATAIALFMARAIHAVHPENTKPVKVSMAVNLRQFFGFDEANITFVNEASLLFDQRVWNMDFMTQGTVFRGMLIRQTQKEYLAGIVKAKVESCEKISKIPSSDMIHQIISGNVEKQFRDNTTNVSYPGRCVWLEIEDHLESIYLTAEARGTGQACEILAFKDKFYMTLTQDFTDPVYVNAFLQELSDHHIHYEVKSIGDLETPDVRLW